MVSVLIVEDNEPMRKALRSMVADLVTDIYECSDGADVLSVYTAVRPDWVLLDLMIGEKGGIVATREITAAYPQAKVVIVANYDDDDLREAARSAGAVGYVLTENMLDVRSVLRGDPASA